MAQHPIVEASSSPLARYDGSYEAPHVREASYLERLFASIRAHWRIFAGAFVACVAVGTIGTLLVPKQYTASVKMIVGGTQTAAADQQSSAVPARTSSGLQTVTLSPDTIANLIKDGPVADKVINTLNLKASRADVLARVKVEPVSNTPIISLSATWGDPAQAVAIANALAGDFVDRDRELVSAQAVAAQTYLQTAIAKAQSSLQAANVALSAYQARYDIADPTQQTQPLLQRVEATESKIEELQDDREQAQAQLSSAQAQIGALPATIAGQQTTDVNPASTELRQRLADTETQIAAFRQRYTDSYPPLIALEHQRDDLQRQLAAEPATVAGPMVSVPNPVAQQLSQEAATLRSRIQGDVAQISDLQHRRAAMAPAIAALPAQATQLGLLEEREKLASDVYNALEQKYDDAVVAANSAVSDLTVVQMADSQGVTVWPNLLFNIIASVIVGLIAGLIGVAIAGYTPRRKIRGDRDIERALGLPVLAHIPSLTHQHPRALPWLKTATLERFLQLCAALRILGRKAGTQVVVITSPQRGDGKTTIAYYVASAMSQVRSRVLLIDADMHTPATHVQAGIENGAGLSEVLTGRRAFDQVVVRYTATMDVLTAGTPPPNPVALAGSAALDDLLDLARQRYDCVIIDTPALDPVIDSALIATRADRTTLVLSADNLHERTAGEAVARLRSLGVENAIGIIINRAGAKAGEPGDYAVYPLRALPSAH